MNKPLLKKLDDIYMTGEFPENSRGLFIEAVNTEDPAVYEVMENIFLNYHSDQVSETLLDLLKDLHNVADANKRTVIMTILSHEPEIPLRRISEKIRTSDDDFKIYIATILESNVYLREQNKDDLAEVMNSLLNEGYGPIVDIAISAIVKNSLFEIVPLHKLEKAAQKSEWGEVSLIMAISSTNSTNKDTEDLLLRNTFNKSKIISQQAANAFAKTSNSSLINIFNDLTTHGATNETIISVFEDTIWGLPYREIILKNHEFDSPNSKLVNLSKEIIKQIFIKDDSPQHIAMAAFMMGISRHSVSTKLKRAIEKIVNNIQVVGETELKRFDLFISLIAATDADIRGFIFGKIKENPRISYLLPFTSKNIISYMMRKEQKQFIIFALNMTEDNFSALLYNKFPANAIVDSITEDGEINSNNSRLLIKIIEAAQDRLTSKIEYMMFIVKIKDSDFIANVLKSKTSITLKYAAIEAALNSGINVSDIVRLDEIPEDGRDAVILSNYINDEEIDSCIVDKLVDKNDSTNNLLIHVAQGNPAVAKEILNSLFKSSDKSISRKAFLIAIRVTKLDEMDNAKYIDKSFVSDIKKLIPKNEKMNSTIMENINFILDSSDV